MSARFIPTAFQFENDLQSGGYYTKTAAAVDGKMRGKHTGFFRFLRTRRKILPRQQYEAMRVVVREAVAEFTIRQKKLGTSYSPRCAGSLPTLTDPNQL